MIQAPRGRQALQDPKVLQAQLEQQVRKAQQVRLDPSVHRVLQVRLEQQVCKALKALPALVSLREASLR